MSHCESSPITPPPSPISTLIAPTQTPPQDTLRLLLKGELTAGERAKGITTEFPLSGLELQKGVITESAATLTFAGPQNKTTGGSCRAGILWAQIEATAKQFTGTTPVRFSPDSLFQP
ncbi:GerMN domain-containing protein [Patescibacteria group bacterium]|nr:GerMN domain-containing protein [Patescibacteria group bacterium]MBP9710465.1 GerMN domain-containing protein [Patescibacteria group bacterium]